MRHASGTRARTWAVIGLPLLLCALTSCYRVINYTDPTVPACRGTYGGAPASDRDHLKVVSFNIQNGKRIDQAVSALACEPELSRADVILLQEMDRPGVEEIARTLGCNYVYYPAATRVGTGVTFGQAILSPWPLREAAMIPLPHAHPLNGRRRIAVAAVAQVRGAAVRVVSVHLETVLLGHRKRLDQIRPLRDRLDGEDGPAVIAGDFNTLTAHGRVLVTRLLRGADFRVVDYRDEQTLYWGLLGLDLAHFQADHIFYRGLDLLDSGSHAETRVGDHRPVWADFALPPG